MDDVLFDFLHIEAVNVLCDPTEDKVKSDTNCIF